MAKKPHATPMLDELETGPWPSFVTGLKRLAADRRSLHAQADGAGRLQKRGLIGA